ncbi:MAG: hypothetical protein LBO63_08300 [Oscillospiraceae bacterium]|nr:hypothetical protein [Oscillospiraceae bacterium]
MGADICLCFCFGACSCAPCVAAFVSRAKLGSFAKIYACAAGGHFLAAARK